MRVTKTAALIVVVAAILFGHQDQVAAETGTPTYFYCTGGCTCTVDPWNWNHVDIDCDDVAPVDECPYDYNGAYWYCTVDGPNAVAEFYYTYYNQCVFVEMMFEPDVEGCTPEGLEPPTHTTIDCEWLLDVC